MNSCHFVMSYSFGKDSTLALHKMISAGHKPVALLVMVNKELERSFFHGIDHTMMNVVSKSLGIPLLLCTSQGEDYNLVMEDGLRQAKALGAEVAVFGDIDISDHKTWCTERCENVGMEPTFPLWHMERRAAVEGFLDAGYTALIKSINNTMLPKELLGTPLSTDHFPLFAEKGVDFCGENGEYHTFAVAGPLFHTPIDYILGDLLDFGVTSVIDIRCAESVGAI